MKNLLYIMHSKIRKSVAASAKYLARDILIGRQMKMNLKLFKLTIILSFFISLTIFSQVRLPKIISDGMVLQRNAEVKIWGWASGNEEIKLHFLDKTYNTKANDKGEWEIRLNKMNAGGPYTMTINAKNSITLNDILIGEVWICSGQSNMEYPFNRLTTIYADEIAASENKYIRQFAVPQKYNFIAPQKDLQGGMWKSANPENIINFSAVSYFFQKELYEKYKVPVGVIKTAVGGAPSEAFMSEGMLKNFPEHLTELMKWKDSIAIADLQKQDRERNDKWYNLSYLLDEGHKNPHESWSKPGIITDDWDVMKVPGYWVNEKLGPVNGIVWFRKNFSVPLPLAGKAAEVVLGRIVDADSVFINGVFVGTTSYQYPRRRYKIPAGLLKEGENTIVIRVISNRGAGGFVLDKPYEIIADGQSIDLKGEWKYKLGAIMEPLPDQTFFQYKPSGLFNGMISSVLNYTLKGVLWYQGESNAERPVEHRKLFPALINDWRNNFKQGNLPFLFVQLPNFMEAKDQPSESNWALFRESQLQALSLPKTAMAVAIDIGEWNDIHPLNKRDVGKRLALAARKIAYGEKKLVYSGPLYKSMKIKGKKIILNFENTGSGLTAKGNGELKHFAIAGTDKQFVWANAKIENNKVIVWSDKVSNPIAVRYAWADNPDGANLYNREELPASPFRTDDF